MAGVDHRQQHFEPARLRSVHHSLANSVAARGTCRKILHACLETLEQGKRVSTGPSEAVITLPSAKRRIFTASAFMIVWPTLTWPSPPVATAHTPYGENRRGMGFHGGSSEEATRRKQDKWLVWRKKSLER